MRRRPLGGENVSEPAGRGLTSAQICHGRHRLGAHVGLALPSAAAAGPGELLAARSARASVAASPPRIHPRRLRFLTGVRQRWCPRQAVAVSGRSKHFRHPQRSAEPADNGDVTARAGVCSVHLTRPLQTTSSPSTKQNSRNHLSVNTASDYTRHIPTSSVCCVHPTS
jgi:hypothetical protein